MPESLTNASYEPQSLEWLDEGAAVQIRWADDHESQYTTQYLRRICPCATCRGTHEAPPLRAQEPRSPFKVLSESEVRVARNEVTVERAYPIGSYAIGFRWSDGHDQGIYSFQYLREMCPSVANAARVGAQAQ